MWRSHALSKRFGEGVASPDYYLHMYMYMYAYYVCQYRYDFIVYNTTCISHLQYMYMCVFSRVWVGHDHLTLWLTDTIPSYTSTCTCTCRLMRRWSIETRTCALFCSCAKHSKALACQTSEQSTMPCASYGLIVGLTTCML